MCVIRRWGPVRKSVNGKARRATHLYHTLDRCGIPLGLRSLSEYSRDLVRGGTPEKVAMTISGHKTRSIFLRYDICSTDDMQQALVRTDKYRQAVRSKVVAMAATGD